MAIKITDTKHYADIAAAIRAKNGKTDGYKPSEMAAAIAALEMSSGNTSGETVSEATITEVTIFEDSNEFRVTLKDGSTITGGAGFDSDGNPTSLSDTVGNYVEFSNGYPISATDFMGNIVPITWGG